jgi:hypothetical protein
MAKGPLVTPEIEAVIARVHQKHPKWRAPVVRNEARRLLQEGNWNVPRDWPSLSTVQKVLATVRRKERELPSDPEEQPWSVAAVEQYPMTPDAIAAALNLCRYRIEHVDELKPEPGLFKLHGTGLSIREAKWAGRLSAFITDMNELSKMTTMYARADRLYRLLGRPFDSKVLDRLMMGLHDTLEDSELFSIVGMMPFLLEPDAFFPCLQKMEPRRRQSFDAAEIGKKAAEDAVRQKRHAESEGA